MRIASVITAALAAAALGFSAQAPAWPVKPIRLIASIAAGSVTDIILRATAAKLQPRLGQPIVIENVGGVSGILGGRACAKAAPDGYTVCAIYHSTMSFNPLLFSNLPYNADTDFAPVSRLFFLNEGVFVSNAINVSTIAELKALAQAKPGALNFANLGDGSIPDLFMKWLNKTWNTRIVGIPYRGGNEAAQALLSNQAQITRFGLGNFQGLVEGGLLKALAVSAEVRSPLLPSVPTLAEAGLPGYASQGWWGIAAPKGAPGEAVQRLSAELVKLYAEPEFADFLKAQGTLSAATTPEGFAGFLREDRKAAEALIALAVTPKSEFKE